MCGNLLQVSTNQASSTFIMESQSLKILVCSGFCFSCWPFVSTILDRSPLNGGDRGLLIFILFLWSLTTFPIDFRICQRRIKDRSQIVEIATEAVKNCSSANNANNK